jgi:hypothetical protein
MYAPVKRVSIQILVEYVNGASYREMPVMQTNQDT